MFFKKKLNFAGVFPDFVQTQPGCSLVELAQVVLDQGLQIGPGVAGSFGCSRGRSKICLGRPPLGIGPLQALHSRQSNLVERSHGGLKLRPLVGLLRRELVHRNVSQGRPDVFLGWLFGRGSSALKKRVGRFLGGGGGGLLGVLGRCC